jgi:hypothetical protein
LSMGCSTLSLTVFRLCDAFGIFSNTFPITLEDSQVFRFKLINFLNYRMKTTYCLLLFELANGDMLLSPTIQDSYLPGWLYLPFDLATFLFWIFIFLFLIDYITSADNRVIKYSWGIRTAYVGKRSIFSSIINELLRHWSIPFEFPATVSRHAIDGGFLRLLHRAISTSHSRLFNWLVVTMHSEIASSILTRGLPQRSDPLIGRGVHL